MGLLDLPAPVYGVVDDVLAGIVPASGRVVIWACIGAGLSMFLYWALSPQKRIAKAKAAAAAARQRLNEHDGDFASAGPLIKAMFTSSFRQLALVFPATIAASLPMLTLLVWLDTSYAYDFPPPGSRPPVTVTPADYTGEWRGDGTGGRVAIRAPSGEPVGEVVLNAPVPLVEKRHWWNALIDNPAGYLPQEGSVERVAVALPEKHYLPAGPDWARSWLALFLPVLVAASLAIHRIARIA